MQDNVRDVNRGVPDFLKLLLEFKEPVLYLFFYIFREDFFGAKELRIIRVACSLNNSARIAPYGLIKLIYASIRQRQLVMRYLFRSGVNRGASHVHCGFLMNLLMQIVAERGIVN